MGPKKGPKSPDETGSRGAPDDDNGHKSRSQSAKRKSTAPQPDAPRETLENEANDQAPEEVNILGAEEAQDAAHDAFEEILRRHVAKCAEVVTHVTARIEDVRTDTSRGNLARLKMTIATLARLQVQVEETWKEIVEHNRAQGQDAAWLMHDENMVVRNEANEEGPGNMKKLAMELRPKNPLNKESTLEEQFSWFPAFQSFFKWNETILRIV
jgi:hypothetical protein